MPTHTIAQTDQQEGFIGELVRSGRFKDANEVLNAGLHLMEQHEQQDAVKVQALRRRLDAAERDLAVAELVDYTPTLLDEIDAQEQAAYGDCQGR